MMNNMVHIPVSANVLCLCRLCGTETTSSQGTTGVNIFDKNGLKLDIKSKIKNCLGYDIIENDFFPKVICIECINNLEKFNEFKIKSNETSLYLMELITKQISGSDDDHLEQSNIDQDNSLYYPEVHIKVEDNELQNHDSTFLVQIPPQVSNVHTPSLNTNKMSFERIIVPNDMSEDDYIRYTQAIVQSNNVSNTKAVNNVKSVKSCVKKNMPEEPVIRERWYSEYKCDHCPYVRNTKRKILIHIRYHLSALINYNCKLCGVKLRSKSSLTTHMKRHNKQFEFICNYCGKGFVGKTGFEVHVRTAHTKDFPFHCTKCNKKFASKGSLNLHDQRLHNDKYDFICDVCKKTFKTKYCLHAHKKKHLPEKTRLKYKCQICNAAYLSSGGLKNHMLTHTGELKFECDQCNKRYKDKGCLQVHMLTHTGERSHVCEVCGKAFALKNTLTDHRRIHTGERPFKCDACQKSFTQKSALNRHRKTCFQAK